MNPPSVLLDRSFLLAVSDVDDPRHVDAVAAYRQLVDDFVEQRCLVVARADHLQSVSTAPHLAELFAVVDKLHVARQHRNAAAEVLARSGLELDEAITLVLIRRCRIRRVLSFDERLAEYDIDARVAVPAHSAGFVVRGTAEVPAGTNLAPEAS
jgi:predicted nucleic acid-binding protein